MSETAQSSKICTLDTQNYTEIVELHTEKDGAGSMWNYTKEEGNGKPIGHKGKWRSPNNEKPFIVWFQFSSQRKVSKLGFSICKNVDRSPKKFQIFATNNFTKTDASWNNLTTINDAGFTSPNQCKLWSIGETEQSLYKWYGLKIIESTKKRRVALRDIKMWVRK